MNKRISLSKEGIIILALTIILTVIGVYMVYSASRVWALEKYGDTFYFFRRQLLFAVIGTIIMFLTLFIKKDFLFKYAMQIQLIVLILLILVLIPGLGISRNGSQSWFGIGSFAFQPAELFKIAAILFIASKLGDHYREYRKPFRHILPLIIPSLIGFALIMLQPDLGTGLVMIGAIIIMLIISRLPFKYFIYLGIIGVAGVSVLIISEPYRINRIIAYINPFEDPLGSGFQIIQSLYAISPGGIFGVGIDASIQKHFYLPEPQTDFIYAIICEEFGLVGGLIILLLFGYLLYMGLKVAIKCENIKDCLLAVGITSLIGIQVIINLGVVVGLLPVTGITLPFISYGGSSLVIMLLSVGLLVNITTKEKVKL